jgi:hypothetical protein
MEHKMKITEKIYDVQTGEITVIERDETAQEQALRLEREAKVEARQAEAATKAAQRQAVLNRLGITEEEARILLGGN